MKDQNISFFICYTGTALSCIFRVVRARECDTCLNQSPPHLTCSHSRRGIFLAMSEKRPLIAGADERVSARGLGLVGVIALVIFALAASSTINLRPKGLLRPASGPSQTLPALDAHDQTTLAPGGTKSSCIAVLYPSLFPATCILSLLIQSLSHPRNRCSSFCDQLTHA